MGNRWNFSNLGLGLGLRLVHLEALVEQRHPVDSLEVTAEDFLHAEGPVLEQLDRLAERYPLVLHGLTLSIGNPEPPDREHVRLLQRLAERIHARWVSDHLCWTGAGGRSLHGLQPLPYTTESLTRVIENVRRVQDWLGRPLLLENIARTFRFAGDTLGEAEFLSRVAEEADCALLLDVANVYVNGRNVGLEPHRFIESLPAERIVQLHVAGHRDHRSHCVDSHDCAVPEAVWQLHALAQHQTGGVSTVLEWDTYVPELPELLTELNKAHQRRTGERPLAGTGWGSEIPSPRHTAPPPLTELQQWFCGVVLQPGALAEEEETTAEVIAREGPLSARERLRIHVEQTLDGWLICLQAEFPAVAGVLGAPLFETLARHYLTSEPPDDPNLHMLGQRFPAFLERRTRHLPEGAFVTELARIERALEEMVDAAAEPALPFSELQTRTAEQRERMRLKPCANLRLWMLNHPVAEVLDAVAAQRTIRIPEPRPTAHLLFRSTGGVFHQEVEPRASQLLQLLARGATLGEATAAAFGSEEDPGSRETRVLNWLRDWCACGLFTAVPTAPG